MIALAVLVISGSGRGAGKTAVGCALIASLAEFRWTAVKVTPHAHGVPAEIWEELDAGSEKDTGRYLRAGASRAFLVTTDLVTTDRAADTEVIRTLAPECDAVLVESGRVEAAWIARAGEPHVRILVLAGPPETWKKSARTGFEQSDALVLAAGAALDELPDGLRGKPCFSLPAEGWLTRELLLFVGARMHGRNGQPRFEPLDRS